MCSSETLEDRIRVGEELIPQLSAGRRAKLRAFEKLPDRASGSGSADQATRELDAGLSASA
jgi:hypothetical protein